MFTHYQSKVREAALTTCVKTELHATRSQPVVTATDVIVRQDTTVFTVVSLFSIIFSCIYHAFQYSSSPLAWFIVVECKHYLYWIPYTQNLFCISYYQQMIYVVHGKISFSPFLFYIYTLVPEIKKLWMCLRHVFRAKIGNLPQPSVSKCSCLRSNPHWC